MYLPRNLSNVGCDVHLQLLCRAPSEQREIPPAADTISSFLRNVRGTGRFRPMLLRFRYYRAMARVVQRALLRATGARHRFIIISRKLWERAEADVHSSHRGTTDTIREQRLLGRRSTSRSHSPFTPRLDESMQSMQLDSTMGTITLPPPKRSPRQENPRLRRLSSIDKLQAWSDDTSSIPHTHSVLGTMRAASTQMKMMSERSSVRQVASWTPPLASEAEKTQVLTDMYNTRRRDYVKRWRAWARKGVRRNSTKGRNEESSSPSIEPSPVEPLTEQEVGPLLFTDWKEHGRRHEARRRESTETERVLSCSQQFRALVALQGELAVGDDPASAPPRGGSKGSLRKSATLHDDKEVWMLHQQLCFEAKRRQSFKSSVPRPAKRGDSSESLGDDEPKPHKPATSRPPSATHASPRRTGSIKLERIDSRGGSPSPTPPPPVRKSTATKSPVPPSRAGSSSSSSPLRRTGSRTTLPPQALPQPQPQPSWPVQSCGAALRQQLHHAHPSRIPLATHLATLEHLIDDDTSF